MATGRMTDDDHLRKVERVPLGNRAQRINSPADVEIIPA